MSVNGITSGNNVEYSAYTNPGANNTVSDKKAEEAAVKNDTGVVYEKSEATKTDSAKQTYKPNTELVAKLKADAEARIAQMQNLVEKLFTKQASTFGIASDGKDSMWKFLASGNFTVDAATKAQAQADIAEDGYWGVNQTSDRILDFAKALSGGDPDKMEEMKNAFIKGFKQATGAWGKDLPSISSQTYDAVMEKFDKWSEEVKKTSGAADDTQSQA